MQNNKIEKDKDKENDIQGERDEKKKKKITNNYLFPYNIFCVKYKEKVL